MTASEAADHAAKAQRVDEIISEAAGDGAHQVEVAYDLLTHQVRQSLVRRGFTFGPCEAAPVPTTAMRQLPETVCWHQNIAQMPPAAMGAGLGFAAPGGLRDRAIANGMPPSGRFA